MKKQKLTGRPTKEKSEKKSIKITVKLSEQEYSELMKKVNQARLSTSQFIREAIYSGEIRERFSPEHLAYIRTLAGMANNLNQLAKEAHIYDFQTIAKACIDTCTKIDNLLNEMRK